MTFRLERCREVVIAKPSAKRGATDRAHHHMIAVTPEVDFVAGFDAQFVTQILGNDDLSLRSDTMSHTDEYNWLLSTVTSA